VLAPINVADTFGITVEAFNIAETVPDPGNHSLRSGDCQRKETVDPIDTSQFQVINRRQPTESELENYARFKITESGISPISKPGMKGGNYLASRN